MTETIEQKALALVNEVEAGRSLPQHTIGINREYTGDEALCRAIEQHEAYKQEVSDAVEAVFAGYHDAPIPWVVMRRKLEPFIIPKTDPLVEVINDADDMVRKPDAPSYAEAIRAALAARGLEVRKIGEGE